MSDLKVADFSRYHSEPSKAEEALLHLFGPDAPIVIFDIGACEGEDSVRYARRFPRARVFSFEPLPANQQLVRVNLDKHGAPNAELVPLALSDRAGEAVFHVSSGRPPEELEKLYGKEWNYANKSSSLLPPAQGGPMYGWVDFKEQITVRTNTVDAFCRERGIDRVDFIHMDVQGAEHLVLLGAARMLPKVAGIWVEVSTREIYKGQALATAITQLLAGQGFRLAHAIYRSDGIEGDHLYLNLRNWRAWPYLARRAAGKLKLRLLGGTPSR